MIEALHWLAMVSIGAGLGVVYLEDPFGLRMTKCLVYGWIIQTFIQMTLDMVVPA